MLVVAGESLVDLLVDEAGDVVPRLGGGPFNVARGLARLGAPCALLSTLSDDRFGTALRAALADDGVDLSCLVPTTLPTTLALAELDAAGAAQYRFYADGTAAPSLTAADVAAVLPEGTPVSALHVGALGLVLTPMADALCALVERVGAAGTLVMVDANCRPSAVTDEPGYRARLGRVLALADVVKVSTEDLAYLAPRTPPADAARALLGGGARCLLVTDGGGDVRVLTAAGEEDVSTVPVHVVDTVGAGDAFCAGFLSWWTRAGHRAEELADTRLAARAAAFASRVAGLTCERSGADPPRLAEVERAAAGGPALRPS